MVRFSDLLGGNEPPEEKPAADDDTSPEDVLERLTQFATSARPPDAEADIGAGAPPDPPDPAAPAEAARPDSPPASFRDVVPDADADAPPALTPVADDLLPRGKSGKGGKRRKGRS